jgi:hypothetical protein
MPICQIKSVLRTTAWVCARLFNGFKIFRDAVFIKFNPLIPVRHFSHLRADHGFAPLPVLPGRSIFEVSMFLGFPAESRTLISVLPSGNVRTNQVSVLPFLIAFSTAIAVSSPTAFCHNYQWVSYLFLALLMPCSRHSSGTGVPASACLRIARIWLSEKRDLFM